jgi:2-polyprenyl-3-methyl-5-hydroxy-6-metoxy-1,4-benzoquinol methylase
MTPPDTIRSGEAYWDRAAETYQQDFAGTVIGRTRREAIWRELDSTFRAGQKILEINCGTGLDAVHLAERGATVVACDLSPRMIELARDHARARGVLERVTHRVLPTEQLGALTAEGPFDGAFSSFSGLNCVEDLEPVRRNLAQLVRPGGALVASVMGRFVPWEFAWFAAHRNLKAAMRRWKLQANYQLEGDGIAVVVRSVSEMRRALAPDFRLTQWKGVGIAVPPSYMEQWAARAAALTRGLAALDRGLARIPLIRGMADCALLRFVRVDNAGTVESTR